MVRCEFSCTSRIVSWRLLSASATSVEVPAWMNEHKRSISMHWRMIMKVIVAMKEKGEVPSEIGKGWV